MNDLKTFKFNYGGTILYFGPESTERIRDHLEGKKKALIVTGKRSAKESGALSDIEKILDELHIERKIYDGVRFNPTVEIVEEIIGEMRSLGADFLIAIGGGSVIDSAKLASVAYVEDRKPEEYLKGYARASKHLFLVAVNLTHGTGTEIDRYAVATITRTREKLGTAVAYPDVSVDNPKYMISLSKNQTLFTSLDALYHALESSVSPASNVLVRDLSRTAIEKIISYLKKSVENPKDLEARYMLLYASMLAGVAIDMAGTSIIHGLEHGLSGVVPNLEHGAGLAIIGPELFKLLYRTKPQEAWEAMRALDPTLRPNKEDAERAGESILKFQRSVGFSLTLSDYGFNDRKLREAIDVAWPLFQSRLMPELPEIGKEEIFSILKALL
ncbi:MAG TPA: iron-containing alcohol dehydrogenase [Fervidicoccus fontis]|jgi:alcohol dehydrogenase|uniref:Iron-containing alcohol dehydrogenase n=1 Tax=Fervidicoccus fontis TaxID=683846 RepID=A0A7C2UJR1_9CREN|nr:MAG: alcohol dehydrogenase [Fervidicoccus sp.]HEU97426.1 iron-containing alcohol dehydrogenase [Fervidicoccus fontis]